MDRLLSRMLLLLAALIALPAAAADANWWQAEWKYRKPITVDAGPQGAGLAGNPGRTPLLLRLHTGNFGFDGTQEGGNDLRFVSADGRTVLAHQIEQFDPNLGLALVWVDVPALTASAPQTIWMYYGNAKAPASGNGQQVFDPDYTLVYHFAEANAPARDTTAYGNTASAVVPAAESTVIGRGVQLGAGPLSLPASASLAQEAGAPLTVSAWIKPGALTTAQAIYARRDGSAELVVGIDNRVPFVQLNGQRSTPAQPIPEGQWAHVALTAEKGALQLYLNGRVVAQLSGELPALTTAAVVGADAPGAAQPLANFDGALDELRISRVARPAALLLADATAQGADSRLISYGADEQSAGQSHFAFILKAMPFDAWVVVAILGLMMLLSWAIMIAKSRHFGRTSKANAVFTESFSKLSGVPLRTLSEMDRQGKVPTAMHHGSLWRIYQVAIDEMQQRHQRDGNSGYLSAATIAAIRASMDAVMVREQEAMARRMNWLSTTIEGAPYVGLFGTVIGIMLVFVVAAMAGAVDINSVAPGMAAALLCTAAGLGVAIPALFGYNWLGARAEAIGADMAVFIDEFAARLAEEQDGRGPAVVQG
ncbi:biopolymer transporter ExbB [Stenotrophomonas maltophilia 5BA-I-2]|nr:biopolymer transporter ExbB [Stenotrophomonas maltophilia 5BA-I-2]